MIKFQNFKVSLPIPGNYQGEKTLTLDVIGCFIKDLNGGKHIKHTVKGAYMGDSDLDLMPLIESPLFGGIYGEDTENLQDRLFNNVDKAMYDVPDSSIERLGDEHLTIEKELIKQTHIISLGGKTPNEITAEYELYKVDKETPSGSLNETALYTSNLLQITIDGLPLFDRPGQSATDNESLLSIRTKLFDRFLEKMHSSGLPHEFYRAKNSRAVFEGICEGFDLPAQEVQGKAA